MKKTLALVLSLMLLCVGAVAAAEDVTIEITFDGEEQLFEDFGFSILLPSDWVEYEAEDAYFMAGPESQEQVFMIDVFETEGVTLDEIAQDLADQMEVGAVAPITINGIAFYLYEMPDQNAFGAFVNTENDVYCIHFVFAPYDEDFMDLATQIMASINAVEV